MRYHLHYFLILLVVSVSIDASSNINIYNIFSKLQKQTGCWNISLEVVETVRSAKLDRSGTIIFPEKIIDLCYDNYTEEEGDIRLTFLLAHEFAHLLNNDLEYDRLINPFNNKLSNEPIDIRKQKELNADARAVSLLLVCGYNVILFNNPKKNIITDVYNFYGIKDFSKTGHNYPSAYERVKNIQNRISVLKEYSFLYQSGSLILKFSEIKNNDIFIDTGISALESYCNNTSLLTPEVLNNIGIGYLQKVKSYIHSDDSLSNSEFNSFETGYIYSSDEKNIRGFNDKKSEISAINFRMVCDKAMNYFQQAENISNGCFIPASLNRILLLGTLGKYQEGIEELNKIERNYKPLLEEKLLLAWFYNLKGILYCSISDNKNATEQFNLAISYNKNYKAPVINKQIVEGKYIKEYEVLDYPDSLRSDISIICKKYSTFPDKKITFGSLEKYFLQYISTDSYIAFRVGFNNSKKRIDIFNLTKVINGINVLKPGYSFNEINKMLNYKSDILFSDSEQFFVSNSPCIIFSLSENQTINSLNLLNSFGIF